MSGDPPRPFPADWAREPDPDALHEAGARMEARAQAILEQARAAAAELAAEAKGLFDASARAGSLAGMMAVARLAVADGASFGWAQNVLAEAARRFPDAPARALVGIAPDVLGPNLELGGAGDEEGSPVFTVISPDPLRAAATLDRVAPRLMYVDEHGRVLTEEERDQQRGAGVYTPNYVFPVTVSDYGARISVDTKNWLSAPMGTAMAELIADALAEDRVPAHVAGLQPTLEGSFRTRQAEP